MRLLLVAACLPGATARAQSPTEECEGLPAILTRVPVGPDAVHVTGSGGARFLVFPATEDRECALFPIGRADARVNGRFGRGTKAYALTRPGCGEGTCDVALAVRGKHEVPVATLL